MPSSQSVLPQSHENLRASHLIVVAESIVVGLIAGAVVTGFRIVLGRAESLRHSLYGALRIGSPASLAAWAATVAAAGLLLGWMGAARPMIRGSGIPQLKGVILGKLRMDWLIELPLKLVGGVLAIGLGLSLGREGPSVQIGSYIGRAALVVPHRTALDRKYLIASGAAAGLSAAFSAPLAGVLFALEELHRCFSPLLLACTMGASVAGDLVASRFFGLGPVFDFRYIDPLPVSRFPWIALLGVFCAILGDLFKRSLYASQDLYGALGIPVFARPVLPLMASIPLGLFLFQVTGGGHELIVSLSGGGFTFGTLAFLFVAKFLFTALAYGSGAPGGIFLPLLACGALLGAGFGTALSAVGLTGAGETLNFVILGMAAFFAGVVKAPVTGAVLILEMSGNFNHLGGLILACLVAFATAEAMGSRAVYEELLGRLLPKESATKAVATEA